MLRRFAENICSELNLRTMHRLSKVHTEAPERLMSRMKTLSKSARNISANDIHTVLPGSLTA